MSSLFGNPRVVPMEVAENWGLKFSSQGMNVDEFLLLLEERREAYGLTQPEVLTSLPVLLEGTPLLWYRLHRNSWRSWEDFVLAFREEFEDPDYQEKLAEEIRQRTQGPREPVSEFVIKLQSLMSRLQTVPSPEEQLAVVYKNMHPRYIAYVKQGEVKDVRTLVRLGKDYERLESEMAHYRPPPPISQAVVPDTAYEDPSCSNSATPGQVRPKPKVCFRCGESGCSTKDC
jgi:hypothetical protein